MQLVICDDNQETLSELENSVRNYLSEHDLEGEVSVYSFSSAEALWFQLDDGVADIYILDIDMPGTSGLEIAREIRKRDSMSAILFYTAHMEYVLDGYKVEAIRYIMKDSDPESLQEALHYAIQRCHEQARDKIALRMDGNLHYIPRSEVIYVDRNHGYSIIHTKKAGALSDRRTLQEIYHVLNDRRFMFIDRGVIVNIDYIQRTESNGVVLNSGKTLYVSRRKLAEVRQKLASYWR